MHVTFKDIVHHGAEAAGYIGFGKLAVSSWTPPMAAYSIGKVTYLATRQLLTPSTWKVENRRRAGWVTGLLAGGTTLKIIHNLNRKAMDVLTTAAITVAVTMASLVVRVLADESLKLCLKKGSKRQS